ncbi:unnamed protein product [Rotaria socialis]|uniref:CCHC-type domain-containing protein n=1 Tax=Rotaria socialis TaxID=392032 RepID=A0A820D186_9BILA|nr:unnamed protein product [Rotaria socialis]CAF4224302.1 unnamed protein product [Rotaria socialis]
MLWLLVKLITTNLIHFLKPSANAEFNAINSRQSQQQRHTTSFTTATTKDDCFKFGLCFYCKEPGHRALKCPKRPQQQQYQRSSESSYRKNGQCFPHVQDATESNRLSLLKQQDAIHDKIVLENADIATDPVREIRSMMTAKDIDKSALLYLEGNVNGYDAHALIDCGTSHNFISEDFIKRHKFKISNTPRVSVTIANGVTSYIDQALLDFDLKLDDFNDKITLAYVFPINSKANHDVILGLPWLFKNNPRINWQTRTITIIKKMIENICLKQHFFDNNNVYDKYVNDVEYTNNILINAKQLSRCKKVYLVTIKTTSDYSITTVSSTNKQLKQLLEEFSDVFPDDLIELPPIRDIDHEIKILENVTPPSQPPFRMSQPELVELKRQLEILLEKGFIRPSKSPYAAPV